MTPDRDALRRAEAEATPGPWEAAKSLVYTPDGCRAVVREAVPGFTNAHTEANARLIAIARNALPALLDECDDLAARLAAAVAERDALAGQVEAVKALATGHPSEVVSKYAIRAALAGLTHEQGEG